MEKVRAAQAARKQELLSGSMGTGMRAVAVSRDGATLFTDEDIAHGLVLFDAAPIHDRKLGVKAVMMFALQAASINLGVQ